MAPEVGEWLQSILIAAIVFTLALAGLWLRRKLPNHHLSSDARDGIMRAAGTISLLASLVLGLLLSTAKATLDQTDQQFQAYSADLVLLDASLRDYGEPAADLRAAVRGLGQRTFENVWPQPGTRRPGITDPVLAAELRRLSVAALGLQPATDNQTFLRGQILTLTTSLERQLLLLAGQVEPSVRPLFLVVLLCWIGALFFFFGLNTPMNPSVVCSFGVCALIVGSAFFLIIEMDSPLEGLLRISPRPLELALAAMR